MTLHMDTTSEKWNSEDPFVRRSCYDCGWMKGYVSWWCTSEAAKQDRGTAIPGCIHCPHWKPDFRVIDDRWNDFKVKEKEHYKAVSIAGPRTVSFWIILLLILLAIAMGSCSPNSKLRRAKRLIEKAEAAGAVWETDTVFSEIKVIVPETKIDSVVKVVTWTDTIRVESGRVKTKVLVQPLEKRVYIESKCDPDTIRIEVPVTVNKSIEIIVEKTTFWQKLRSIAEKIVMIIVLLLIGYVAGRMKLFRI